MLQTSEQINEVATAIAVVQGQIGHVGKDGKADAGKRGTYKYATIASVLDEIRGPMSAAGLCLLQAPHLDHVAGTVGVETRIIHTSGQWVACVSSCALASGEPQQVGSGQTYMRRYGIMALLGLGTDDDDGQAARGAPTGQPAPAPVTKEQQYRERFLTLCKEKQIAIPDTAGWDVAKFIEVGTFVGKNNRLPELGMHNEAV